MKKNFYEALKEQMIAFLKENLNEKYEIKEGKIYQETEICLKVLEKKSKEDYMIIKLYIDPKQKVIGITNILNIRELAHQGLGKRFIKEIYEFGKKYNYRTFGVDLVRSFYRRLKRRGARVVDIETVEITDETDLLTQNKKEIRAYTFQVEELENVKEELKLFGNYNNLSSILSWELNCANFILKDFNFKENNEKKILIFGIDYKYILDVFFDKNDPASCDPEYSDQFLFVIPEGDNNLIEKIKKLKGKYCIDKNHFIKKPICLLFDDEYDTIDVIQAKTLAELKNQILYFSKFKLNILKFAKEKNKLVIFMKK